MPSFHHLALGVSDVVGVSAFYRDMLGLAELAHHFDDAGELRSIWLSLGSGARLMIERSHAAEPVAVAKAGEVGRGFFLLAVDVAVTERQRLEQRLEAAGYPIEDRTEATSYFRDPAGNRVAISHYPKADQSY